MLDAARKHLLETAAAQHALADAGRREHWVSLTEGEKAPGESTLAVDPEHLNTPSARTSRLVANVAHTLVV